MEQTFITNGNWNYTWLGKMVGGPWPAPNISQGYHGLLAQWWEAYDVPNPDVLLVSENNNVKKHFNTVYPSWKITTSDYFDNMGEEVDLKLNLCEPWSTYNSYDKIINQATFEHLYDPITALKNLAKSLKLNGEMYLHTVVPGFVYHQVPRDYFRFYPDWFIDAEQFVGKIKLKELYVAKTHIFVLYKRDEE